MLITDGAVELVLEQPKVNTQVGEVLQVVEQRLLTRLNILRRHLFCSLTCLTEGVSDQLINVDLSATSCFAVCH